MKINFKGMTKKQRQHHIHQLPSLLDTARLHGDKFFNFLPDHLRGLARQGFEAALAGVEREEARKSPLAEAGDHTVARAGAGDGDAADRSARRGSDEGLGRKKSVFEYSSSSAGVAAALNALLHQTEAPEPGGGGALVVVLVTDYFQESLQLLDHVYATSLFTSPSSTGNAGGRSRRVLSPAVPSFQNRAQPWQEQGLFSTSPAEMKVLHVPRAHYA